MYLLPACCHLSFGFHVLSPMNFCSKALIAAGKLSKHCSPYIYLADSKIISRATGASGNLATPNTKPLRPVTMTV
jgi:hypothetical protein